MQSQEAALQDLEEKSLAQEMSIAQVEAQHQQHPGVAPAAERATGPRSQRGSGGSRLRFASGVAAADGGSAAAAARAGARPPKRARPGSAGGVGAAASQEEAAENSEEDEWGSAEDDDAPMHGADDAEEGAEAAAAAAESGANPIGALDMHAEGR